MKSEHLTPQPTYAISGKELRIYFNEEIAQRVNEDQSETVYIYDEAVTTPTASRHQLIETIIASVYSTGRELATINNQLSDPDEYAAYQAFRTTAKQLADGWLNR